jgi:hypothetical protein
MTSTITEFEIIYDGAGDPYTVSLVAPLCHGCHKIVRGHTVKEELADGTALLWHKGCFLHMLP